MRKHCLDIRFRVHSLKGQFVLVNCDDCEQRFVFRWLRSELRWRAEDMRRESRRWAFLDRSPAFIPTGRQGEAIANSLEVVQRMTVCGTGFES